MNQRPNTTEYAAYYHTYVGKVPDGNIVNLLEKQMNSTLELLKGLSETQGNHRYEESKWSIKELVNHILDTERVFAYRALCISRGDQTPLPGFSQDDYVAAFDADARSMEALIEEFEAIRRATTTLFKSYNEEMLLRIGTASDYPVSVRALGFIILGHELHHINILTERYL